MWWRCVLNCFILSSLPCFYAFCWCAIPTSCYIFNVFYCLVADACLSWSLPSITEQQVSPHRLPMQYWLKNYRLSSNTPITPTVFLIQQSCVIIIIHVVAKWLIVCACVHVKKACHHKGSHSSSVSYLNRLMWLQTWTKAMGWCTAQWKMLLKVEVLLQSKLKYRSINSWAFVTGEAIANSLTKTQMH